LLPHQPPHPRDGALREAPRLTYAITSPNVTTPPARRRALAEAQSRRIAGLPVDLLFVYDVQDEAARNGAMRPFPFVAKTDPLSYAFDELAVGGLPRVVYRAVAGQTPSSLRLWLEKLQAHGGRAVLVGAPSRHMVTPLRLAEAFALCRSEFPRVVFGGVVIPERHHGPGDEDARVWSKMQQGCAFFVSQTVWCVETAKTMLRDLHTKIEREGIAPPPILLTFSPCGSPQTLAFLEWLGVRVPSPVARELLGAEDMLARSVDLATEAFAELAHQAAELGLTIGCNVESVSSRPAEVDASVELLHRIDRLDARALPRRSATADKRTGPLLRTMGS